MMLSECVNYIVRFFKGSSAHELHVLAHDKEQAAKLAEMQCKYSNMGTGKFEIIDIRKEGEPDLLMAALDKFKSSRYNKG